MNRAMWFGVEQPAAVVKCRSWCSARSLRRRDVDQLWMSFDGEEEEGGCRSSPTRIAHYRGALDIRVTQSRIWTTSSLLLVNQDLAASQYQAVGFMPLCPRIGRRRLAPPCVVREGFRSAPRDDYRHDNFAPNQWENCSLWIAMALG